MDTRHQEYVDYYRARMKRYEGNPLYARSYLAEKRFFEGISACEKLEDFRTFVERGHPEQDCAIALVHDQESARLEHFKNMEETVRAKAPERILRESAACKTALELTALVSKIEQEVGIEIAVDGFMDGFYGDFELMENIAAYEAIKDEVPDEWKAEIAQTLAEEYAHNKAFYAEHTRKSNRNYAPTWDYDYSLVHQARHRRGIPFPDEIVARRISDHKKLMGLA